MILYFCMLLAYGVSYTYIEIKIQRFLLVDSLERRMVVEMIAHTRLRINSYIIKHVKLHAECRIY